MGGLGSCALQELPRFPQQSFNALERGDLFVWNSIQILLLLAQLQLKRFLTLFQFHQTLRQSRDGLREIFRSAGDPKRHGGCHHRKLMVALMTTQERRCLKIKLT